MDTHQDSIRQLVSVVRRRWLWLVLSRTTARAASGVGVVVLAALVAARLGRHHPSVLATITIVALLAAVAAIAWPIAAIRRRPGNRQVARYIEERVPSLDDCLVSAVELLDADAPHASPLAGPFLADAAQRAVAVDPATIVPGDALRRAGFQAAAAALALLVVLMAARRATSDAFASLALTLFPAHVELRVTPGTARVVEGQPLNVEATLVGSAAPLDAQIQIGDGERWQAAAMARDANRYTFAVPSVTAPFKYRLVAGPVTTPVFDVTVARRPRVTRIDIDYTYPPDLPLKPRSEEDTGDVYAPVGTVARIHVRTDRQVGKGRLALAHGAAIDLTPEGPAAMSGTIKVTEDDSYRVAVVDQDGLTNGDDSEYFIRILNDRPPDVHVIKPAADRSVTRLEEVQVEAQAEDDYGIERVELVYSVAGGPDRVVRLPTAPRAASVTATHTLFLEDLNLKAGDLVSYYVRARDVTRGKRSNEARSDIFFLEVRPFEQEFALAQSQSMAGSGYTGSIDDLINAQKQVVVATWKIDRRTELARGAAPEQDIRTVSKSEAELKTRVEQTSSSFRESTMRDPRRRAPRGGRGQGGQDDTIKAGETMPEEDEMTAAATAMGQAVTSLDALKTHSALTPEMEALNHLLRAQADVKRRQIARQQASAGAAGNANRNYDISTLFDQELKRNQQTNYESPNTSEQKKENGSKLDRLKEMAKRQDELLKQQQDLAKAREKLRPQDVKRALEQLTREQEELRRQLDELAKDMEQDDGSGLEPAPRQGQRGGRDQKSRAAAARTGDRMRAAADEMQSAVGDLQRQDAAQASARSRSALNRLRDLERQMQADAPRSPDERHRALGDAELEGRQLADAEREVASRIRTAKRDEAKDAMRRLAGEQEQLADRARELQDALNRQAAADAAEAGQGQQKGRSGAGSAAREMERQRLADRLKRSAEGMRAAAGGASGSSSGGRSGGANAGGRSSGSQAGQGGSSGRQSGQAGGAEDEDQPSGGAEDEIAKSLDKVADAIAAANAPKDADSKRLADQLARTQQLKDRLQQMSREMEKMAKGQSQAAGNGGGQQPGSQSGGQSPGGQASGGQSGGGGRSGQGSEGGSSGQGGRNGQGGSSGGEGGMGSQPGGAPSVAQLRDEYARQLADAQQMLNQLRQDDPASGHGGGSGYTFENPGNMTMSAPGTEAFKQDFARWEQLRQQVTAALETAEASLSKRLEAEEAKDRLAAGIDDKAPPSYQQAVDSYFKALATGKK